MKLYTTLEAVLKTEPNYVTDDGNLKKWVVINKAQNYDAELLSLLLENEELKKRYFKPVAGALVFDQNGFINFLEQKNYLNDSYTAYKNKVGLNIDGKYLKQRNEVSLVWPFKDCVLEGGQSREEDKREEIFFNETLAQDEITQLIEPKVLTNAKRFSTEGEKPLDKFNRNEEGIITDNLIIKGNNLLALHTLKEEFAGKVKLIYIDPPYNTGNDGFKYNDSFNHSTWLTFMRNRLTVAKQLLREDGVILVQCDDNEQAYLKVLLDEIFGRENFIASAPRKTGAGAAAINSEYALRKPYDFVLISTKNKINTKFNKLILGEKEYNLKDEFGTYTLGIFQPTGSDATRNSRPNLYYPIYLQNNNELSIEKNENTVKEIFPDKYKGEDGRWMWKKEKFINDSKRLLFYDGKKIKRKIYFDQNQDQNKYQVEKAYFDESNYRNSVGTIELKSLFESTNVFNNPKPEYFLEKLIQIASNEDDIILDYHLGSGTTAAVAHKMNRQYIGIEQMDYIETVAVERLKKVIEGEQGGISKSVNWQGGGEFVYLELKKYNQTFIEQIASASSTTEILEIWEQMKAKSFLNYNVDIQKQEKHIEDFKALTLAEQKQHLVELLDKNQLYVNLSSLHDNDFEVSVEEKKVTQDFYQIKK
jgi:adenine-specific DNA-methyltransferase